MAEVTDSPIHRFTECPSIHCRMSPTALLLQSSRCPESLLQVIPFICTMSSRHLFTCLPRDLLSYRGCQSVILFVHLLSLSLATWPAHFHFCLAANLTTICFCSNFTARHFMFPFCLQHPTLHCSLCCSQSLGGSFGRRPRLACASHCGENTLIKYLSF